jgi:hypothetical protein
VSLGIAACAVGEPAVAASHGPPPRDVALLEGVRRDGYLDALLFRVGEDVVYGVIGRADAVDDDCLEVERVYGESDEFLDGIALDGIDFVAVDEDGTLVFVDVFHLRGVLGR